MKVALRQTIDQVPNRCGSVIIGLGVYWDFGKRVIDDSGKKKLYGTISIDFLIWSLNIGFRGGLI